jgi:hypothetical protein
MYKLLLSLCLLSTIFCVGTAQGQAKGAIGFGPSISHFGKPGSVSTTDPFRNPSYEKEVGFGGVLQGEIKLGRMFSLVPSLGVENQDFGYLGLYGKLYISDRFSFRFGTIAYSADAFDFGFGPSMGIGYQLVKAKRNSLDLDFHGEMADTGNGNVSLVGLRLTYNFFFSKPK